MQRWRLANIILIVFSLGACDQVLTYDQMLKALYSHTVPVIQPEEVQNRMKANKELVLLDIRSPREYEVSHIPGARLIDFENFSDQDVQEVDPNAEVIVYCSVGYRSEKIGERLQEMGFRNVKNIYGGIFEWKNTEHPVVDDEGQPTERIHTYNKMWSRWVTNGIKVYE